MRNGIGFNLLWAVSIEIIRNKRLEYVTQYITYIVNMSFTFWARLLKFEFNFSWKKKLCYSWEILGISGCFWIFKHFYTFNHRSKLLWNTLFDLRNRKFIILVSLNFDVFPPRSLLNNKYMKNKLEPKNVYIASIYKSKLKKL